MSKGNFYLRLAERAFWTGVQAALALVTVDIFNVTAVWVTPIALALAIVKGFVAKMVGDPNSPALGPTGV